MARPSLMRRMVLYLMGLSGQEWLLVVLIVVLLFGAAKIPDLARALGRAKAEYRKGSEEGAAEEKEREKEAHQ